MLEISIGSTEVNIFPAYNANLEDISTHRYSQNLLICETDSSRRSSSNSSSGRRESSYKTNIQDESYFFKSIGTSLFTAYGTDLANVDAQNDNVLDQITIPNPVLEKEGVIEEEEEEDLIE